MNEGRVKKNESFFERPVPVFFFFFSASKTETFICGDTKSIFICLFVFQIYERGVAMFKWPNVFDIWNTYLTKFIHRYVSARKGFS